MKNRELGFRMALFLYHLMFAGIAYAYFLYNKGDAHNYWNLTEHWTSYIGIGTKVIKLINYPLATVLQLPFWFGFLIYNLIGFLAIWELYSFAHHYISPKTKMADLLLKILCLLPNLHFWTSIIGKEPVVFLAVTWVMTQYADAKFYSFKSLLGWLLLMAIRPHVAMFLLLAVLIAAVFSSGKWSYRKIGWMLAGLLGCFSLYILTLKLLNRNPFDIQYILERNDASLIAFRRANSYVPMIDYNIVERFFALNFRPFFWDADSFLSLILSVENGLVLLLLSGALFACIRDFKTLKGDSFANLSMAFFLISSCFFIQRYACLGIFVRTKMMYMPFVLVAALKIILPYVNTNKK